jgi:hypothetical protein
VLPTSTVAVITEDSDTEQSNWNKLTVAQVLSESFITSWEKWEEPTAILL